MKDFLTALAIKWLARHGFVFFGESVTIPYGTIGYEKYKVQEIISVQEWREPYPPKASELMGTCATRQLARDLEKHMEVHTRPSVDFGGMQVTASIKLAIKERK